jgi:hypothetical protein
MNWNRKPTSTTAKPKVPLKVKYSQPVKGVRVDDYNIIITLPLTPSINREPSNRFAKQNLKNLFKQHAYECWQEAGRPKFGRVTITPVFYVKKLRDEGNEISLGMKGAIDGLQRGNMIVDDSPEYMTLAKSIQNKVTKGELPRVELHITGIA